MEREKEREREREREREKEVIEHDEKIKQINQENL